jgi:hypothetical protein
MTADQLAALIASWLQGEANVNLPLSDALEELGQDDAAAMVRRIAIERMYVGAQVVIQLDQVFEAALYRSRGPGGRNRAKRKRKLPNRLLFSSILVYRGEAADGPAAG